MLLLYTNHRTMLKVLQNQQRAEEARRVKQLDSAAQQNNYIKKNAKIYSKKKKKERRNNVPTQHTQKGITHTNPFRCENRLHIFYLPGPLTRNCYKDTTWTAAISAVVCLWLDNLTQTTTLWIPCFHSPWGVTSSRKQSPVSPANWPIARVENRWVHALPNAKVNVTLIA